MVEAWQQNRALPAPLIRPQPISPGSTQISLPLREGCQPVSAIAHFRKNLDVLNPYIANFLKRLQVELHSSRITHWGYAT
jgi:hypothetical protein